MRKLDLFDWAVGEIEQAYQRLGHRVGWRFLATARRTLRPGPSVAFITLNPGGSRADPEHGGASCENGSAYVCESWRGHPPGKSPLQQQVQRMCQWLRVDPNEMLSAYFVPFRSPSLETLVSPEQSMGFAVELWTNLFSELQPGFVVCIGGDAERGLKGIWGQPIAAKKYPVGWGAQTAGLSRYRSHLLLRLPHLSRFGLFGRSASLEPLKHLRRVVERERGLFA